MEETVIEEIKNKSIITNCDNYFERIYKDVVEEDTREKIVIFGSSKNGIFRK